MKKTRKAYRISVEEHIKKHPVGGPKKLCDDNIKKYLRKIGREDGIWVHLIQSRAT
jgi:hypothetical protein